MRNKNDYRLYFAKLKEIIKIKYFLNIAGIPESNFSRFMKSDDFDYYLSIEKLENLKNVIVDNINNSI